ncbi:hypothetical protein FVEG_06504 [Fusarium verticillioides 7600]|uniref:Major facilitator superfamily (MFS) profile domain-containing protein n=1 Tax=Gibberella moniliformis (strain M3125 / FGSC 7600) TaxID=334819 RepID=W7M4B7_GIBM7|nr:hypothetical protein FVEG_06504 [Fusarium verticillioides 7600]EWG45856.1 hypothetical protein FVEG_06504 [Fusarium verticillioides 7600]
MDSEHDPLLSTHQPLPTEGKKETKTKLTPFVLTITFVSGLSSMLSGYETGVTSAALVSIGSSLSGHDLTSIDKAMITSATAFCALFTAPFASLLADKLGRKRLMLYADMLFITASVFLAFCKTITFAIMGRCIIGMAVAFSSVVVPLYIAEIAPASRRGMLITATILLTTLGQIVGFMTASMFAAWGLKATGWRWTFALGVIPASTQGLLISFMPDTPRWLVMVGCVTEARRVLHRIYGNDTDSERLTNTLIDNIQADVGELRTVRQSRRQAGQGRFRFLDPWKELLSQHRYRRGLTIAILLMVLQQFCGFTSLMYFSATIFELVGFKNPTLASVAIASTNFTFTAISLVLIDRVGRRRMLLRSLPFMILGLFLAAAGFHSLSTRIPPKSTQQPDRGGGAIIVLTSIVLFVASFALGLGNVPSMQSELYPLAVRSLGSGVAMAAAWSSNFIIGLTFLPLTDALTPAWTMVLYAGLCIVGYYLIYLMYPETAGLSIEEAAELLEHGWTVK